MKTFSRRHCIQLRGINRRGVLFSAPVRAEPPAARGDKPHRRRKARSCWSTSRPISLRRTAPGTANLKEHYAKTRMLERTVELVKKARAKGVLIVTSPRATRRTRFPIRPIRVASIVARSTAALGRSDRRRPRITSR